MHGVSLTWGRTLWALVIAGSATACSADTLPSVLAGQQQLLAAYPWLPYGAIALGIVLIAVALIGLVASGTARHPRLPGGGGAVQSSLSRHQPATLAPITAAAQLEDATATLPAISTGVHASTQDEPSTPLAVLDAVPSAPAAATPVPLRPRFCGGCGTRLTDDVEQCPTCGRQRLERSIGTSP